jgi:hypothetical protein
MHAYKLDSDPDRFRSYLLPNAADHDVLDEIYGKDHQSANWRPIRVKREREGRKELPPGDVPCIFIGPPMLALSQRAVEALRDLLEPAGEFLPLECEEEPLWLYNCTRFADVLDEARSEFSRYPSSGRIMTIHKYLWRPGIQLETCFRLPQFHRSPIYATDTVVDRIRGAGLQGFRFRE